MEHQTTNLRVGRSNRSGRTISQKREKWGMSPDQVLGAFRTKSSSASWILFPLLRKAVVFPICCPARTMSRCGGETILRQFITRYDVSRWKWDRERDGRGRSVKG